MKQCTVIDCNNKYHCSGFCVKHYTRYRKHGDITVVKRKGSKYSVDPGIPNQIIPGWNSWKSMKNRCLLPHLSEYKYYGGRGIKVCDRWLAEDGFKNFIEDMGKKPTPKHSIDRIDPNGNYEPNNCEWATKRQQTVNKRNWTKKLEFQKYNGGWSVKLWKNRRLIYFKDFDNSKHLLGAICVADYRWITPSTNTKVTREVVIPYSYNRSS